MADVSAAQHEQILAELALTKKKLEAFEAAEAARATAVASVMEITLEPSRGRTGMPITIKGKGFGKEQGTSLLIFEGHSMRADSWSDTAIVVKVPGSVKDGDVIVAVGNRRGSAPFTID